MILNIKKLSPFKLPENSVNYRRQKLWMLSQEQLAPMIFHPRSQLPFKTSGPDCHFLCSKVLGRGRDVQDHEEGIGLDGWVGFGKNP